MKLHSILATVGVIIALLHATLPACPLQPPLTVGDNGTASGNVGQSLPFSGLNKFYCPDDGQIVAYRWVLPPQAYQAEGDNTSELRCKFSPSGTYEVELQVKCSHGIWNTEHLNYPNDNRYVYVVTVSPVSGPWYVKPDGSDADDGRSWLTAFRTIQTAINSAVTGQEIIVASGAAGNQAIYHEQLDLKGKSLTIRSDDPDNWEAVENTIIDAGQCGTAVLYRGNESGQLKGFTITGGAPTGDGLALHFSNVDQADAGLDLSGKGRHGTVHGPVWVPDDGGALSFDGIDDYIVIDGYPGIVGKGSRTCMAWVKTSGTTSSPYAVMSWGKDCASDSKFVFGLHPSGRVCVYTYSFGIVGTAIVNDGNWHHIAAVLDSDGSPTLGEVKLYVNGILQSVTFSGSSEAPFIPVNTEAGDFLVGAYDYEGTTGLGAWYKGEMDDLRLYSRALSESEIQQQIGGGPVAHWKLDEESGTDADDSSGNDLHGTLINFSASPWTSGRIGGGLEFNGTSDYVSIPYDAALNPVDFTISFWARVDGNSNLWRTGVMSRSYVSQICRGYVVYASNDNKWEFWTGPGTSSWDIVEGPSIEQGKWTHVACSYTVTSGPDASGIYTGIKNIYIDGMEATSISNKKYALNSTEILRMAKGDWEGGYFNGCLDDIRIYDRALSAFEIQELAEHRNLVAHWKLDGDALDSSGYGHDGLIENNPSFSSGIAGQSLTFNGTDQYVSVPHHPRLKPQFPLALSAWINLASSGTNGFIITTDYSTNQYKYSGVGLRLDYNGTDKIVIGYGDGTAAAPSGRGTKVGTTVLQPHRWYHVVGVIRSPQDMSIYINGRDDGGEYTGTSTRPIYYEGNEVLIGNNHNQTQAFSGKIDDVRIYNYGLSKADVLTLHQIRFADGGGIRGHGASVDIEQCIIKGNQSVVDGGGISGIDGEISRCFIVNNSSETDGGGLAHCDGNIINCVIAENTAENAGAILGGSGALINCTITNNTATNSVGGVKDRSGTITNTILWGNTDTDATTNTRDSQIKDCSAAVTYSCIQDGTIDGMHYAGTGNIDDDPLFKTDGYHLGKDSPCINNGLYDERLPPFDIDGQPRLMDTLVDIGADEVPTVIYVNQASTEQIQNGCSWEYAFTNLQDAFDEGVAYSQIWVAKGVYTPDKGGGQTPLDRNATFELPEGVEVYGGFSGIESSVSERNWIANPTILSGDLNHDDSSNNKGDNSYHVVKGANNTILDGFIVVGGNANGTGANAKGGGVLNISASPMIRNCTIIGNQASDKGGGIYNDNCTLSVLLSSCNVIYNSAGNEGGGMYNNNAKAILTNCIFWGNTAGTGSSIVNLGTSETIVSFCDIQGSGGSGSWNSSIGTDGGNNIDADPLFVDYDGIDNIPGTEDDDYSLDPLSPCLNGGIGGQDIGVVAKDDVQIIGEVAITDPVDIAIDQDGYLYVLSSALNTVYVLDDQFQLQTWFMGSGLLVLDAVYPMGICVDADGKIYIADTGNNRLLKYTSDGILDASFGNNGIVGQSGTGEGEFNAPWGIGLGQNGNIYVSDNGNNRIQVFGSSGQFVQEYGEMGSEDSQFDTPMGICLPNSLELYIADSGNHRIQKISPASGLLLSQIGEYGVAPDQFDSPSNVCYDSTYDQILVADTENNRIQIFQVDSSWELEEDSITIVREITGLSSPFGVACSLEEDNQIVYVADTGNNRVVKIRIQHDLPMNKPLSIWEQFKNALRINDISTSLYFISEITADTYSQIFNALAAEEELQDYVDGMGLMLLDSYEPGRYKYEMLHQDGENLYSFPVFFIKDDDGNWKIFKF